MRTRSLNSLTAFVLITALSLVACQTDSGMAWSQFYDEEIRDYADKREAWMDKWSSPFEPWIWINVDSQRYDTAISELEAIEAPPFLQPMHSAFVGAHVEFLSNVRILDSVNRRYAPKSIQDSLADGLLSKSNPQATCELYDEWVGHSEDDRFLHALTCERTQQWADHLQKMYQDWMLWLLQLKSWVDNRWIVCWEKPTSP